MKKLFRSPRLKKVESIWARVVNYIKKERKTNFNLEIYSLFK
jgi:hypothetical protein